jgi:hypothetical protein
MVNKRGAYRGLVGRPHEKRLFATTGHRCKNTIKMDLQRSRVGRHGLDRCGLLERQVVGAREFGKELSGSIKCGEFLDQLSTC